MAFIIVVGTRVLDPTNLAWLVGGDPATHYLGWLFYRNAPLASPLGLNTSYGLEIANSIIYSDSIPLLAFAFKPVSSLLPHTFQYFGLWILSCFILQAWFAWKLIGLISEHVLIRALSAGLFCLCTTDDLAP
ncbi:DUF6311 domain-containing protein [Chlorobium phaeovibrioides]|uniref:DUF6311 domain-containing protein n=1 Tax=Chlorobium phaeovibrioides TaxID=1094 RepID=UPI00384C7073